MPVDTCYISSNCNQTATIADWGPNNNLICYGSCNAILIYDPNIGSGGRVTHTLVQHSKRINSVRWLRGPKSNAETELVSGSSDGTAIVWRLTENRYVPVAALTGHTSSVNIVDGLYKNSKSRQHAVVATVSMDCTVKIWYRPNQSDQFILSDDLNFGHSICVGIRLNLFPYTNALIAAIALDTSKIHLYVAENAAAPKFTAVACLKGHEDWVRGLDFTVDRAATMKEHPDLILASSGQDQYIRIWRITKAIDATKVVEDQFDVEDGTRYRIYIDSVLIGHEGWIYSVNWSPLSMQLLSASLDKSMIIWELDAENGLWLEKVRVGEVGGNTLGFYGGLFGPHGLSILAHSYHGAFHLWTICNSRVDDGMWRPSVTIGGGHFAAVTDLAWEPHGGEYLMSVSADQTARVHAPWPSTKEPVTWHEIGRPQIHGYDIGAVALFSRYCYASAAEEKVIRTFQAPQDFIENFNRICRLTHESGGEGPKGASVPPLGLSNKAIYMQDDDELARVKESKGGYVEESQFTSIELTEPPTEETLLQNTLWPEVHKLYGHGYEVYCLAASPNGRLLASACKATTQEHAAILLWNTSNWSLQQKLLSHTLTVVQMSFAPDSQRLLSVSRDRRWSMFALRNDGSFELVATTDKQTSIHTRIIWCCAWSSDSRYFATGSRDGRVVVWTRNDKKEAMGVLGGYEAVPNYLELRNESITAVAFAPSSAFLRSSYLVAVGLESGLIRLYEWRTAGDWRQACIIDKSYSHHLTVRKLAFRPVCGQAGYKDVDKSLIQLASCSLDYSVRIYNVNVDLL